MPESHLPILHRDRARDLSDQYQPFPLTDIQHAYWIGRGHALKYGNTACHVYFEWVLEDLDLLRLEKAWNHVIHRHAMMRAVIESHGMQRILPDVPWYKIVLDTPDEEHREECLEQTRRRIAHQVMDASRWPLFELRATRVSDCVTHLHLDVDLLMFDVQSFHIFLSETETIYAGLPIDPPAAFSFRDYVLRIAERRHTPDWQDAQAWWQERIKELPPPPVLPLVQTPSVLVQPRFCKYKRSLDAKRWALLEACCTEHNLTASAVLLTAFSEVLAQWSTAPHFTLNLTHFNRERLHPDVMKLIGDFTSVLPVSVDCSSSLSFSERTRIVQKDLWSGLSHRLYSGVDVIRDLTRKSGDLDQGFLPVVFTSILGLDIDRLADTSRPESLFSEPIGLETSTPQVWLDHQVMVRQGMLIWHWIVIKDLFPDGLIESMLSAYDALLDMLIDDPSSWGSPVGSLLPSSQKSIRRTINATECPVTPDLLHHPLWKQHLSPPQSHEPIVIHPDGELSPQVLRRWSLHTSHALKLAPQEPVAIMLGKSLEQIIAVFAILNSGGAYVPIAPDTPMDRCASLFSRAGIRRVFCLADTTLPSGIEALHVPPCPQNNHDIDGCMLSPSSVEETAYIIYTSGSTGQPKGVVITHKAAHNTLVDINRRFDVGPKDRILGLSGLSFDLSVYDLFGTLAAGGTVILPREEQRLDPEHWLDCMTQFRVTIWNTVPALMDMLITALERTQAPAVPQDLRLILLSGDWIPISLPARIRAFFPNVRLIALGGATEAAIWSNWFDVTNVDPHWRSIPYGVPLSNQRYHILDQKWHDRPDYVTGDLFIAGDGLATGYYRDTEQTDRAFVKNPSTHERLYRTGDLARYWPDGTLEFMGRADTQVKIAGQRVELGDIDATLVRLDGIHEAVTLFTPASRGKGGRLTAFVTPSDIPENSYFSTPPPLLDSAYAATGQALKDSQHRVDPALYDPLVTFERIGCLLTYAVLEDTCARHAWFENTQSISSDHIIGTGTVTARYKGLIACWLRTLCDAGILAESTPGFFYATRPLQQQSQVIEKHLDDLRIAESFFTDFQLSHWVVRSITHLDALLSGQMDPLEVFMPQGGLEHADTLYRHNPLVPTFGQIIGETAAHFLQQLDPAPRTIMEIGAGTGGITSHILSALNPETTEYLFTDVSPLFLTHAGQTFRNCTFLRTGIYDATLPPQSSGYCPHSVDVIIASQVLHGLPNIPLALSYLRQALKPGGMLILRESTKETALQLITAGFLENISAITDHRQQTGHVFVDIPTWLCWVHEAGFLDPVTTCGYASWSKQHVITARAPNDGTVLQQDTLTQHMATVLPPHMIPTSFVSLQTLPKNDNGKIDRGVLAQMVPTTGHVEDQGNYNTETESTIAEVWQETLGKRPGPSDNFFMLGGDSLLAVQMVNSLRGRVASAVSLKDLFENPVLCDFAARLDCSNTKEKKAEAGVLPATLTLKSSPHPGTHVFLLPGSDGLATVFASLAAHLPENLMVTALRAPGFNHDEQPAQTVESLTDYFCHLVQSHVSQENCPVYIGGWSFGALLTPHVVERLRTQGILVAGTLLIDPPPEKAFAAGRPEPSGQPAFPSSPQESVQRLSADSTLLDDHAAILLHKRFLQVVAAHRHILRCMSEHRLPHITNVPLTLVRATLVPPEWTDLEPYLSKAQATVCPATHWGILADPRALATIAKAFENTLRHNTHEQPALSPQDQNAYA